MSRPVAPVRSSVSSRRSVGVAPSGNKRESSVSTCVRVATNHAPNPSTMHQIRQCDPGSSGHGAPVVMTMTDRSPPGARISMLLTVFPFSGESNGLHQFLHGFVQWTQNQDPSSWLTLQRHAIETPQGDDIIGER